MMCTSEYIKRLIQDFNKGVARSGTYTKTGGGRVGGAAVLFWPDRPYDK